MKTTTSLITAAVVISLLPLSRSQHAVWALSLPKRREGSDYPASRPFTIPWSSVVCQHLHIVHVTAAPIVGNADGKRQTLGRSASASNAITRANTALLLGDIGLNVRCLARHHVSTLFACLAPAVVSVYTRSRPAALLVPSEMMIRHSRVRCHLRLDIGATLDGVDRPDLCWRSWRVWCSWRHHEVALSTTLCLDPDSGRR
jgi:hypothetical protein